MLVSFQATLRNLGKAIKNKKGGQLPIAFKLLTFLIYYNPQTANLFSSKNHCFEWVCFFIAKNKKYLNLSRSKQVRLDDPCGAFKPYDSIIERAEAAFYFPFACTIRVCIALTTIPFTFVMKAVMYLSVLYGRASLSVVLGPN